MNMLLIDPAELLAPDSAKVKGPRAHHLVHVLRVAPGATIRLGLLNGPRGQGQVLTANDEAVELRCFWDVAKPNVPPVDLILAMPRPKVMKRLWAQLAALGVRRIAIVNAERVERFYFDSHVLSPPFYRPLLIEGLEQSETTFLPEVRVEKQLKVFIEDDLKIWTDAGVRLAADVAAKQSLPEAWPAELAERAVLAVGPETGWSDYERDMFVRHGFRFFTAGRRTLRADTACVALLTLVRARLSPHAPLD